MTYDHLEAQAKIDAFLSLPATLAGSSSAALDAAAAELAAFCPTVEEFAGLLQEVQTALDTVCSALLAMRDTAIERERAQP